MSSPWPPKTYGRAMGGTPELGRPKSRSLASSVFVLGFLLLIATVLLAAQHTVEPSCVSKLYVGAAIVVLIGAVISSNTGALTLVIAYFFAMFMAIPAAIQIREDSYPFGGAYTGEQLNSGLLVVALGQLSLIAGMGLSVGVRSTETRTVEETPGKTKKSLFHVRSIHLALGLALTFTVFAAALGVLVGPGAMFTARADSLDKVAGSSQTLSIARSLGLVALLLCVIAIRYSPDQRTRRKAWRRLVPVSAVTLIVNFPPALPRFQLFGVILAVAVVIADFRRPIVKSLFVGIATFFLLFFFARSKDLRGSTLTASLSPGSLAQWNPREYLLGVDFDGFKQTVDTIIYYANASPRWGANFLGVLLFWVPRGLWTGKPVHTGQIVSEGLGYWYNNVSSPLPAEAFASWRFVGVVGVLLILGAIVMRAEQKGRDSGETTIVELMVYALATGYSTILLRGALNAVAPMIGTAFILAFVVLFVYSHNGDPNGRLLRHQVPMGRVQHDN